MCCVMPPASPATTSVSRIASSSDVLPWSTWPMIVTTGGRSPRAGSARPRDRSRARPGRGGRGRVAGGGRAHDRHDGRALDEVGVVVLDRRVGVVLLGDAD